MTSTSARPRTAGTGTALAPGAGRTHRVSLAWPRLPAAVEVAIIAVGYIGYALVRLPVKASHTSAFVHAAQLWAAERAMHIDIEPSLNHLTAAHPALAQMSGYYYGLAHFLITPLVLAWLWLRRPAAFGPLRSALVLSTTAANLVFWTWPAAPPRFAVPGMTDVLDRYHILGSGDPHGPDSLVNLYAAMPSLHVAWAAWCAAAVVIATRGRWRHLAWLYPAATTFVVLASANHFVLDVVAGLAVMALGLLAARGIPVTGWHGIRTRVGRPAAGAPTRPDATGPVAGGAVPTAASPAMGPAAAPRDRRPVIWWPVIWGRGLARRWAWAVTGGRRRARGAARSGYPGGREDGGGGRVAAAVAGRRRGRRGRLGGRPGDGAAPSAGCGRRPDAGPDRETNLRGVSAPHGQTSETSSFRQMRRGSLGHGPTLAEDE